MLELPTPRTDAAWYESRHGEDGGALLTEARKLEREVRVLKDALILIRDTSCNAVCPPAAQAVISALKEQA